MPLFPTYRLVPSLVFSALLAVVAEAAEPPAAPAASYSPAMLPGHGLAQHPFMYAGEWNYPKKVQTLFIIRDGQIAWSYDFPTNLVAAGGRKRKWCCRRATPNSPMPSSGASG